ncbi:TPA: ead/Ea22-like family protein [Escherichia coli]|nr:ead/Ea22-like family protein [Escherichia coli]
MIKINYQALREAAQKAKELGNISRYTKAMIALLEFKEAATPDAVLALLDELETAEKRIAELEAREISLPERSSMLHRTDFHEDYQTVMAYKVSEVIAAIRAAGIRIKGE